MPRPRRSPRLTAARARHLQRRGQRPGAGRGVAAVPRQHLGREAPAADARLAGAAAGRRVRRHPDDQLARMLEREGQERARLGASVRELARGIPGLGQRMRRARRPLLFSIAYGMTGSLSSRERALNEVREEPCAAGVRVEVWVVDSQLEACTSRRRHKGAQQSIDLVGGEAVRIRTIYRRHH